LSRDHRARIWLSGRDEIAATVACSRVLDRAGLPVDTAQLARLLLSGPQALNR
jgi:hypothetical protein